MVIGIIRPRQNPKIQFIARPISENKIRSTIKCQFMGIIHVEHAVQENNERDRKRKRQTNLMQRRR
jgi:hypothetical protein